MRKTIKTIVLLLFGASMLLPVWAQEFSADWVGFDGEKTHTLARVMRSQHLLRVELPESDGGSATGTGVDPSAATQAGAPRVLVGDRRAGLGIWVSDQAMALRRDALPAPLVMKWPLRDPAQLRCEDPAWRCSQLESLRLNGSEVSVWQLQHFERGIWRDSMLWQSADAALVLREQWPEGRSVQLLENDRREHQGREVLVQWYLTTDRTGTRWHSRYWYDPMLDQVVREDLPDGSSRWLENIRVEAQAPDLFALPTSTTAAGPSEDPNPAAAGPPGPGPAPPGGPFGMDAYFDPAMPPPPGLAGDQVE